MVKIVKWPKRLNLKNGSKWLKWPKQIQYFKWREIVEITKSPQNEQNLKNYSKRPKLSNSRMMVKI